MKRLSSANFLYFIKYHPILNFLKEKPKQIKRQRAKVEKTTKQEENQQIFIVTLTEKFSMPDYWYMLYKFTQYT